MTAGRGCSPLEREGVGRDAGGKERSCCRRRPKTMPSRAAQTAPMPMGGWACLSLLILSLARGQPLGEGEVAQNSRPAGGPKGGKGSRAGSDASGERVFTAGKGWGRPSGRQG